MDDSRSGVKSFLFVSAGVVLVAVLLTGIMYLRQGAVFGEREKMLQLVSAIRVELATASEAEKSAVASESDQDTAAFADRARSISMDRKRRLDALCQDTLVALEQSVQQSLTKWKASNPREIAGPK